MGTMSYLMCINCLLQTYQTSEAVENFLYNSASGAIHFNGSGVSPAIL